MNFSLQMNGALPAGAKRQAEDADLRTLYVHRQLKNAGALREWAKAQGFKLALPADDMHVTVAFSKTPIAWDSVPNGGDPEGILIGGGDKARSVEALGADGAVVLRFESGELAADWRRFMDAGASWDHDAYRPHVTITYDAGDVDLSKVEPYAGPLEFGPEVFAEVKGGATKRAKENLQATDSAFLIAMDRDSVREKTRDGRLIVKRTPISKANVCPYRGEEIPGWEALGLDKNAVYKLLRDPEELAKGAATSNGVQLLIKHVPVNAEDHRPNETVGSLGTDAEFDGDMLYNSLFVNAQRAIDGIERNTQRELSAGYHYKPDMTPGNFRGSAYDGVMRDIVFNHVALVEDGRAGPDVVVGDEALKENDMKATRFGAMTLSLTAASIAPLLAMDQKIVLPKDLFAPLTTKNFKDSRDKLLSGVRSAVDGKLRTGIALDATMKDFANAIDAFTDDVTAGVDEPAPEEKASAMEAAAAVEPAKPIAAPGSTYDAEPLKGFLKQYGMDDANIAKCMDMMPKALAGDEGESDEDKAKREAKEKEESAAKDAAIAAKDAEMKDMVSKPAMDAAIDAAVTAATKKVRETEQGIRVALVDVKPWVGELPVTLAFDSAEGVYRQAAKILAIDGADKMHADALFPVIKSHPKPGAKTSDGQSSSLAMDASSVGKAVKMAPGLENISVL